MSHADGLHRDSRFPSRRQPWMLAAYASFGLALLTVLAIAAWGASVDFEEARVSLLQEKVNTLRTHGVRSVLRIHEIMNSENEPGKLDSPKLKQFLHAQWIRAIQGDPSRIYAALTDVDGRILVHHLQKLEGGKLDGSWYRQRVPIAGDDVVETTDPRLTGGDTALDIMIPIFQDAAEIGTYHSGFNLKWFEQELALKRRATTYRWSVAFLIISAVVLLAGFSLFQIAKRLSSLQSAVAMGHVRRLADLGQLAGGIAHEIRNPLNAIRLNLHVIQKLSNAGNAGDQGDQPGVIEETVHEIDRVDGLLRTMLEYARPEQAHQELIDVSTELRSVVGFLTPLLQRDRIDFSLAGDSDAFRTKIDRGRFRQIGLNLLKNAMEAVGPEGRIAVDLQRSGDWLTLTVSDTGVGLPTAEAERIFDPFFSTKELGTGLGLTLVKRYVEEAGGKITARRGNPRGAVFQVELPLVKSSKQVAASVSSSAMALS
ncbi:MAG: hypothetical protein K8U03_13180 [Planctomycetia bacterium]|nr:hypothetical protein [Planctomycetia bacterium]